MELWEKKQPKFKDETNPLKGKWGFSGTDVSKDSSHANNALEATRRMLMVLVQKSWDHLTPEQTSYMRDVFDFERAWYRGECRDWRLFWNQPGEAKLDDRINLDSDWWNIGRSTHPTEKDVSATHPTPAEKLEDKREELKALLQEAGLIDGIQEPR